MTTRRVSPQIKRMTEPRRSVTSVSAWPLLAAALFLGLVIWNFGLRLSIWNSLSAVDRAFLNVLNPWVWLVFVGGAVLAISGGIGATAYFLSGRRQGVAEWTIVALLLLGAYLPGVQLYDYYTRDPRNKTRGGNTPTPAQVTPLQPSTAGAPRPSANGPTAPTMTPFTPKSPSVPAVNPPPADTSTQAPASPAVTPSSNPPAANPTPAKQPADAAVEKAAAQFTAEIENLCKDAAEQVRKATEPLSRVPSPNRGPIEDRIKTLRDAESVAKSAAAKLRSITNDATARLRAAGADIHEASRRAMEINNSLDGFQRAIAAEALGRLCDRGADEAQLLVDNLGRWRAGAGGKADSSDAALKGRLGGARFMVENAMKDRAEQIKKLTDGK